MDLFHSFIHFFLWIHFVRLGGGLVDGTKRGHWWKRPIPCQFHASIVTLSETRDQPVVVDGAFVTIIIAVVAGAVIAVIAANHHEAPTTNCLSVFHRHRQYNQTEMIQLHLFHRCRRRTPPLLLPPSIVITNTTTTVSASATATAVAVVVVTASAVMLPAGWQNNNNNKITQ